MSSQLVFHLAESLTCTWRGSHYLAGIAQVYSYSTGRAGPITIAVLVLVSLLMPGQLENGNRKGLQWRKPRQIAA